MILDITPLRKHRDYRLLYIGQGVSTFGSMITYVAVPVQVFDLTHSSFVVGMLGAVQLIPLLCFALWGGAYADAMDRRRLLIISEILMTAGSAALAINSMAAHPSVVLVFVVSATMSAVNGFHRPSLDAMLPRLVDREDLTAISALRMFSFSASAIVGPAIGGVLIGSVGYSISYIVDVATFVFSLGAIAAIRSMPAPKGASSPGFRSIVEGLKYARSHSELIGTYVVDMIAMTFAMPMALFPAMASAWGATSRAGWLFSAISVGSLLTSVLSGWASRVRRDGAAVVVAAATWGLAIVGFGFSPGFGGALACLVMAGAADAVSGLFRMTIWNETIPTDLRGRLAGVEMISYLSGPLLGNARAGWIASISSNTLSVVSGGVICVLGVLLCVPILPRFWTYQSERR